MTLNFFFFSLKQSGRFQQFKFKPQFPTVASAAAAHVKRMPWF